MTATVDQFVFFLKKGWDEDRRVNAGSSSPATAPVTNCLWPLMERMLPSGVAGWRQSGWSVLAVMLSLLRRQTDGPFWGLEGSSSPAPTARGGERERERCACNSAHRHDLKESKCAALLMQI